MKDFENIPSYIDHYDDIVYAIRYENGNTRICLSKKLPNGRVLIIETVSKSRGSVAFKNMIGVSEEKYIDLYERKYKKRNSSNTRGGKNPNISLRDETVSKDSIHNSIEKVKENTKQTEFDEIVAMGESGSKDISPKKLTRAKNMI